MSPVSINRRMKCSSMCWLAMPLSNLEPNLLTLQWKCFAVDWETGRSINEINHWENERQGFTEASCVEIVSGPVWWEPGALRAGDWTSSPASQNLFRLPNVSNKSRRTLTACLSLLLRNDSCRYLAEWCTFSADSSGQQSCRNEDSAWNEGADCFWSKPFVSNSDFNQPRSWEEETEHHAKRSDSNARLNGCSVFRGELRSACRLLYACNTICCNTALYAVSPVMIQFQVLFQTSNELLILKQEVCILKSGNGW